MQFREICLLQCSTIINTFWVDPHSELLKKVPVKPKNCENDVSYTRNIVRLVKMKGIIQDVVHAMFYDFVLAATSRN